EWRQLRTATSRDAGFAVFAGVALALHFWAWNASIHLTTIAASVTLVSLQPAVIAATSALVLRESPTRRQLTGIAVAILGAFISAVPAMAGGFSAGNNPLLGNVLAISAALTAAMYYTIGRSLRAHLGLWSYVAIVYAAAFATLIVIAVVRGIAIAPQPAGEIRIFVALAVGPMLLGHTGMNWALKYLPAYVVNLTVLGEPVGATLLGALIPSIRQIPTIETLVGGVVVLTGVVIASRSASTVPDSTVADAMQKEG
ncbi:MAG TPA: DMT family transporter, partial [Gemmatimonadaceae bacterium]|nr:DMT family transporter [Gemmatimonadaceae bacterium]